MLEHLPRPWQMLNRQEALEPPHATCKSMPGESPLSLLLSNRLQNPHWDWDLQTVPEAFLSCQKLLQKCSFSVAQPPVKADGP